MAAKKQGIKVDEAVPKSLGVAVGGNLGVLIPKNTKIPCVAEKDYVNADSGKEYIGLQVWQGDNPDGADGPISINNCDKIGHLLMKGFGKYEQGEGKIKVKFSIDESGILSVSATDVALGQVNVMSVHNKLKRSTR